MSEHKLIPINSPDAKSNGAEQGYWDQDAVGRRGFFNRIFWVTAGAITFLFGGISTRFLAGKSLEREDDHWVQIGRPLDLPVDQVQKLNYSIPTKDAWEEIELQGVLYAYQNVNGEHIVLDAICTHTGCNVRWIQGINQFLCPCHSGVFSREGTVVSGPPPRPLRRLETKIQNGILYALV